MAARAKLGFPNRLVDRDQRHVHGHRAGIANRQLELTWLQLDSANADLFDRRNRAVDQLAAAMEEPPNQSRQQQKRGNRAEEYERPEGLRAMGVVASMLYPFTSKKPIQPSSANSEVCA